MPSSKAGKRISCLSLFKRWISSIIKIDDEAIRYIAQQSNGDFRFSLNYLEIVDITYKNEEINLEKVKKVIKVPNSGIDNDGDGHYDAVSALQKSIRGSDVDASLHYLARLIVAGDLDSIYRRMSVIAYEDIGLANPGIGPKVMAAIEACELVGLPEARIILGEIITEMALSPKSNSTLIAIDEAINDINKGLATSIPKHIHEGSPDYIYPHNYKNDYVPQEYMPANLKNRKYYQAKDNKYEANLNKIYKEMRNEKWKLVLLEQVFMV